MPTGSCSRRSKQTAHAATRRSGCRLWHCTLGRLALLFRLLSLPQPFRSALFSSAHTHTHTHSYCHCAHLQQLQQQQLNLKHSLLNKCLRLVRSESYKRKPTRPRTSGVQVAMNFINVFLIQFLVSYFD